MDKGENESRALIIFHKKNKCSPVRGHEAEGDEAEGHEEADPEPADQLADGVAGWVLLPPLHPLAALQYAHQLLLNVHRHELIEEGNKISCGKHR